MPTLHDDGGPPGTPQLKLANRSTRGKPTVAQGDQMRVWVSRQLLSMAQARQKSRRNYFFFFFFLLMRSSSWDFMELSFSSHSCSFFLRPSAAWMRDVFSSCHSTWWLFKDPAFEEESFGEPFRPRQPLLNGTIQPSEHFLVASSDVW